MTINRPLRLALFGSGRIGQVHAANIAANPGLELAVIADPFVDGARKLAETNGADVVSDPSEVLARDDLDGVIIGSPTSTHVDLINKSVDRGLAVLCEKPIDLDIDVVTQCRERIGTPKSPIMLGFNRRFDPSFAAINRRVAEGEIGKLEQLTIISRDPAPAPRDYIAGSGGIFRDMTIHDLDMARFFVPDIVEVSATATNVFTDEYMEFDDYDSAVVTLKGRDGELITITNSRHCAYGYDQRLEAFGPDGMLSATNMLPTTVKKYTRTETEQSDPYMNFFLERYVEAYAAELEAFAQSIRTGEQSSPTFDDGVMALVLANAAEESVKTGSAVQV
ncbi:inositol 2-dehydrogenase [Corynebacterium glyciniphilum]|uniref:inositol 2-dehydrogenase n=1 Tax=Corynebacterium glyciniphilum TaxID=1404244 RepID=UPI003FD27320